MRLEKEKRNFILDWTKSYIIGKYLEVDKWLYFKFWSVGIKWAHSIILFA